jgi:ParB family transcriptional regulator, chromosome partitioning protein
MTKDNSADRRKFTNLGLFTADDQVNISDNLVPINKIKLPSQQPRRYFDPAKQDEMVSSISKHGILEPLIVRLIDGEYELVAGERRLRAAKTIGLTEVPIVLKELDDQSAKQIALVENLQRENLNPLEETEAILELIMLQLDLPKDETIKWLNHLIGQGVEIPIEVLTIFDNLSMTLASYVQHRLPLLKLPEDTKAALAEGKIEYTKAREIGKIRNEEERQIVLAQAINLELPLSKIKEKVKHVKAKAKNAKAEKEGADRAKKTSDVGKSLMSLCKQINEVKPWDDPKSKKQLEKAMKILQELLQIDQHTEASKEAENQ